MTKETLKKSNEFLRALDLESTVFSESNTLTDKEKNDSLLWNNNTKELHHEFTAENKLNSQVLKSFIDNFLVRWNESIGIDTEVFWNKLRQQGIGYKRREPLKNALQKGRFRNVHEGMQAAKNFDDLINSKLLESSFSDYELSQLKKIISQDINERIDLLKHCLNRGAIPSSKYLRFGDSLAFINECKLWEKFFTENEVQQLIEIWTNRK